MAGPEAADGGRAAADRGRVAAAGKRAGPPADPAAKAREICLRLLSVRPRTRMELEAALLKRGTPEPVVAEVLDRYSEVGMIDDAAFARAWVSSRHHGRGLAGRALAGELRRKGVAPEAVGAGLAEIDAETELATARALVRRRLTSELAAARQRTARGAARAAARGEDAPFAGAEPDGFDDPDSRTAASARRQEESALVRKLVGVLARKGYPPGTAFSVVKEALAEHHDTGAAAEMVDLCAAEGDSD